MFMLVTFIKHKNTSLYINSIVLLMFLACCCGVIVTVDVLVLTYLHT